MADKKKIIDINIQSNVSETEKDLNKLNKELKTTDASAKKASESTKKASKGFKGLSKAGNLASKGIKGIGVAMKAAGIGLVVTALASLMAVFSKNQKVVDAISTAMNTLQLGVNAVTDAISSAYTKVKEATGGFDALKKVVLGVLNVAITPLKLAFYQIKSAIQVANVAYQNMFGDDASVKQAKKDLFETTEALKQVGKDAIQSGKDIVNNFGEAVSEVGTSVKTLGSELGKIDPKKILEAGKSMTKLKNNAEVASALQAGLNEDYNRQAELIRQLRDDDRLSIDERIKANNKLKDTLLEQSKSMLKQADLQIASAQANVNANNSIENQVALIDALNNKKAIQAQVEGFLSEQKANEVALDKEKLDLINAVAESDNALAIQKKKNIAEGITDDEVRLKALRDIAEEEKEIELRRLTAKRDSYNEGTQAWVDAQEELRAKRQEYVEQDNEFDAEAKKLREEKLLLAIEEDGLAFEEKRIRLQEQRQAIIDDEVLSEEQKAILLKKIGDAEVKIQGEQQKAKEQSLMAYANIAGDISNLIGKETAAGKALAIADATISTYFSAQKAYESQMAIATPDAPVRAALAAGVAIAQGVGSVKNILDTKIPKQGGGGGKVPNASKIAKSVIPQPQRSGFDATGIAAQTEQRNANQIAEAQSSNPVRAYVTTTDVESGASFERNRVQSAGF